MTIYTEDQVRKMLTDKISFTYNQADMASESGVSRAMVSRSLAGNHGLGIELPRLVGMKRVIAYVRDDA